MGTKIRYKFGYESSVTKVDNDTRETAIYNSLRTGSGDLVTLLQMKITQFN